MFSYMADHASLRIRMSSRVCIASSQKRVIIDCFLLQVVAELALQVLSHSISLRRVSGEVDLKGEQYLPKWEWDGPACAVDTPAAVPQDVAACLWSMGLLGEAWCRIVAGSQRLFTTWLQC